MVTGCGWSVMLRSGTVWPNKLKYIVELLKSNPSEIFRLAAVGYPTAKFRYLIRCTGKDTVVEPGTKMINSANINIGDGCVEVNPGNYKFISCKKLEKQIIIQPDGKIKIL